MSAWTVRMRATAALTLGVAMLTAQVPRPAQSSAPKLPSPAPQSREKPPAAATPAKGPTREAPLSYSLGLPQVPPPLAKLPTPHVEQLPNGLGLVIVPSPGLPLVDVALIFATGYGHDPAGKRGMNRAVAQGLRFGGTLSKTEQEVETYLLDRNLTLQVVVGPELTEWFVRCRTEDLADLLGLLAEMIAKPAFRRNAIEAIWQQMRQTIQARGQNLDEAAAQEVEAAWFGADSSWTRNYQDAEVEALDRDSMLAHLARSIVPSRTVIGLSGDIDIPTARGLLERTFGSWAGVKTEPAPAMALPSPARKLIVLDKPNSPSARLLVALPLKQRAAERSASVAAALGLFATQIDSPQESTLAPALAPFRSAEGPIRITPGLGLTDVPLMRIAVPLRPREAIDGTVAAWKEMQSLQSGSTSAPKLEAAKRAALRSLVYQEATSAARFLLLVRAKALGLSPGYWESIQQAIASMTPAEYQRIVKEQINLDAAQLVLIGDERDYRSPPETTGLPVVRASTTPPPGPSAKTDDETASRTEALRLLDAVQKAMGGAEALAAIRDANWDYEAKLTRASPPVIVTQRNSWLLPGLYRQEQTSSIGSGASYYDGKVGWVHNGRNLVALLPPVARQYRNEVIRLLFRLVLAGGMEGYRVSSPGSGVVKIVSPEKYEIELALDFQTNLPERLRFLEYRPSDNAPIRVEEQLSDYRPIDGVLMPHRIVVKQVGQEFAEFTMKRMRFNTGLTEEQIGKKP